MSDQRDRAVIPLQVARDGLKRSSQKFIYDVGSEGGSGGTQHKEEAEFHGGRQPAASVETPLDIADRPLFGPGGKRYRGWWRFRGAPRRIANDRAHIHRQPCLNAKAPVLCPYDPCDNGVERTNDLDIGSARRRRRGLKEHAPRGDVANADVDGSAVRSHPRPHD